MGGPRIWTIAALLMANAGCEWIFGEDAPHYTEAVALTAPWSELGLALDGAKVTFSDAETLSVHHVGSAPADTAAPYTAALSSHGWTLDADTSAGGVVNQTWSKEGDTLALSVQVVDDATVVSLSILPF